MTTASLASPAIRLDEATHTYYVGHRKVTSVSRILKFIDELEGVDPEILRLAATFGRHVHKACHLWNMGCLDEANLDPLLAPYLQGWKNCLHMTGAVVLESEMILYDQQLGLAGQLDDVVRWNISPRPVEIDIKTNSHVLYSSRPQTALYKELYERQTGTKLAKARYVAHLTGEVANGSPGFVLKKYTDDGDLHMGISCLNVWRGLELAGINVWRKSDG